MDLPEQKIAIDKLSVADLRALPRDEIENLVTRGLLEADLAAEIQSEDMERQQEKQQPILTQHAQAQFNKEEKADEWLKAMSASYQQAYRQLMNTYDDAENQYGTIKNRAAVLRERLREKAETAYQYGVPLSNGKLAFYDRNSASFVDDSLQHLRDDDAKTAAGEFKLLSPHEQNENACYVDARRAYADAEDISRSADASNTAIENQKNALKNSHGEISEDRLKSEEKAVKAGVNGLSNRLINVEQADANLDAALSDGATDDTSLKANGSEAQTTAQTIPLSFAAAVDGGSKGIGDGNGKTATSFNVVANPAAQKAPDFEAQPANRFPSPVMP